MEESSDKAVKSAASAKVIRHGIWANFLLVIGKAVAGLIGNSSALLADAAHSLSDFITDFAVLIGIHFGNKPEDESHNYGHGKIETLIAAVVGLLVVATGVGILMHTIESIHKIVVLGKTLSKPGILAVIGAAAAIVIKEALFHYTLHYGKKFNSEAMVANAWHHRSDVLSTIGVLLGAGAAYILGDSWSILDPVAGLVLSIIVIISGLKIAKSGLNDLVETSIDAETQNEIYKITEQVDGAKNPHKLRTRKVGSTAVIDLHIYVSRDSTIVRAHNIATEVENRLKKELFEHDAIIYVHVEPEPQQDT